MAYSRVRIRGPLSAALSVALVPLLIWFSGCQPIGAKRTTAPSTTRTSERSIRQWTACNGRSDDTVGFSHALVAARHGAFILVVDCQVVLKIGKDIAHTQFIDDGTTIAFRGEGKISVDNVFVPAFAIASSKDISLSDWNIEYTGRIPFDWDVGGYDDGGKHIAVKGYAQPAFAFNDRRLSPWLTENRHVLFDHSMGSVGSRWYGPTNTSAVFFIIGDVSHLRVTGMHLYVSGNADGSQYAPMVFSLQPNWNSNQTVTAKTPWTSQYVAVPHNLTFSDIDLDGTYMGWQGNAQDVIFERIHSHRYGDVQDSHGGNAGGKGKWFAPPHLFYLNYSFTGDPELANRNIKIKDVIDDGQRAGVARDKMGDSPLSGYALSLKIGCNNCSVDGYKSRRPDGFLDLLPSDGITISNVEAIYDSAFLNNIFPGWRFPSAPYRHVTFQNINYADAAAVSLQPPIGSSNAAINEAIVFRNVHISLNAWGGSGSFLPQFGGAGNDVSLDYRVKTTGLRVAYLQKGSLQESLELRPPAPAGGLASISWDSKPMTACALSGAATASGGNGKRDIKLTGIGMDTITLTCRQGTESAALTMPITATP